MQPGWHTEGNGSLRIQGNKWYRNSQGAGGNAVDFLMLYCGFSAKEAIEALAQYTIINKKCWVKEKNINTSFQFEPLQYAADQRRVIAYLVKTRRIPYDIVIAEIHAGLLFQEPQTGNAVFLMTDELGNITGAEVVGTITHFSFKGVKAGSGCGFGYSFGQKRDPKYILFFESAVDLLSFVAISRIRKKSLTGCLLVSLAGLKQGTVNNMLRIYHRGIPVLCVDNDFSGRNFISRIRMLYTDIIIRQPEPQFKDWNDQLRCF
jgi:hypothetical protein